MTDPTLAWCWPQSVLPGEPVSLHVSGAAGDVEVSVVCDGASPVVVGGGVGLASVSSDVPGMHLVRKPKRPKWRPFIQINFGTQYHDSWKHFLDLAYWNVELDE